MERPLGRSAISTKFRPLEFRVYRGAQSYFAQKRGMHVLAMVSGGADSMAMLHVLVALKARLKFDLDVLHVHHGPDDVAEKSGERLAYRDSAAQLVSTFCDSRNLRFHLKKSDRVLKSEAEFREFRWESIQAVMGELSQQSERVATHPICVAFAHHREDLLETRLIRLLRGTGKQGLRAMSVWGTVRGISVWRPFLSISKGEIRTYLSQLGHFEGTGWVEDVSNADPRFLRNAIRHRLLPLVESLRPNSIATLARSLEILASDGMTQDLMLNESSEISRSELMSLSPELRRAKLGQWLRSQGVENYSSAHIEEVLKRLDTDQRRLKFIVCGRVWLVDEKLRIVALSQQVLKLE
jgi:tRNA(Ile)-lysidine synthase